jgi:hypothetical protein
MRIDRSFRALIHLAFAGAVLAVPVRLFAATSVVTDFGDSGAAGQLRTLINAAVAGDTIVIPPGTVVSAPGLPSPPSTPIMSTGSLILPPLPPSRFQESRCETAA